MTQVGTNMLHRATNDLTLRSHPQPVSDHSRRSIRLHGKLFSLSACSLLVSLRSQHPFDIFSHCFDSFPEVDRPPPPQSVTTSDYGCRSENTSLPQPKTSLTYRPLRNEESSIELNFFNHICFSITEPWN